MRHEEAWEGQYALALPGAVLLCSGQALLDVQRSLEKSVREQRVRGRQAPVRVSQLIELLGSALDERTAVTSGRAEAAAASTTSTGGSDRGSLGPTVSTWHMADDVDAREAGEMLGVTDRQVRNRAGALGGRKIGRQWWFARTIIAHEAARLQQQAIGDR